LFSDKSIQNTAAKFFQSKFGNSVHVKVIKNYIRLQHHDKICKVRLFKSHAPLTADECLLIAVDQYKNKKEIVAQIVAAQLGLNKRVFARKCVLKKINLHNAEQFFEKHHLMGYAKSAYHYGLFKDDELLAAAAFSKGRKMRRLPEHLRSFELIRFCSKGGTTVTGGLSKLIAHFSEEKKPGDIMTYIDKQYSRGSSYLSCGFTIHSHTEKQFFLVHKKTNKRTTYMEEYNTKEFYCVENSGNLKLVLHVAEQ